MEKSELRRGFDSAVDAVEDKVEDILESLRLVEDEVNMDPEIMDHDEIRSLQSAVQEALTALKELVDALY